MKRSEMINLAQQAVIDDRRISSGMKVEIVVLLEEKRTLEEYLEAEAEKKAAAEKEAE